MNITNISKKINNKYRTNANNIKLTNKNINNFIHSQYKVVLNNKGKYHNK